MSCRTAVPLIAAATMTMVGIQASVARADDWLATVESEVSALAAQETPTLVDCPKVDNNPIDRFHTLMSADTKTTCSDGDELDQKDCTTRFARVKATAKQLIKKGIVVEMSVGVDAKYSLKTRKLKLTILGAGCHYVAFFTAEPRVVDNRLSGPFYTTELPMTEEEARAASIRQAPGKAEVVATAQVLKVGRKEIHFDPRIWGDLGIRGEYMVVRVLGVRIKDKEGAVLVATGRYAAQSDSETEREDTPK